MKPMIIPTASERSWISEDHGTVLGTPIQPPSIAPIFPTSDQHKLAPAVEGGV